MSTNNIHLLLLKIQCHWEEIRKKYKKQNKTTNQPTNQTNKKQAFECGCIRTHFKENKKSIIGNIAVAILPGHFVILFIEIPKLTCCSEYFGVYLRNKTIRRASKWFIHINGYGYIWKYCLFTSLEPNDNCKESYKPHDTYVSCFFESTYLAIRRENAVILSPHAEKAVLSGAGVTATLSRC